MHNRALKSARAPGVGRSKAPGFLVGRFLAPGYALLLWEMEKGYTYNLLE